MKNISFRVISRKMLEVHDIAPFLFVRFTSHVYFLLGMCLFHLYLKKKNLNTLLLLDMLHFFPYKNLRDIN